MNEVPATSGQLPERRGRLATTAKAVRQYVWSGLILYGMANAYVWPPSLTPVTDLEDVLTWVFAPVALERPAVVQHGSPVDQFRLGRLVDNGVSAL